MFTEQHTVDAMRVGSASLPLQTPVQQPSLQSSVDLAIIILNYKTCDLLRNCLSSVFASQDSLHKVVCVVDNASNDGSAEMVQREFPQAHLIVNLANIGYPAGNNVGLRWLGFGASSEKTLTASPIPSSSSQLSATNGATFNFQLSTLPRYALLLNPDTLIPPTTFALMTAYMDANPTIGVAGPRVRRPDGSLDRACRRSFPTPQVSFYRQIGLSRLFPKSKRFNAYNLEYLPEEAVHPVDSVVGAYMQVRCEAIEQVGLLDESFFMYGEDLDWAKRIKDAGWEVWYNGQVEMTHVKEAASSQSIKARIDFYEAMWIFYRKHYHAETPWWLERMIALGIVAKGGLDVAQALWRFCRI